MTVLNIITYILTCYHRKFYQHIYVNIYSHKLVKRSLMNAFEWTHRNGKPDYSTITAINCSKLGIRMHFLSCDIPTLMRLVKYLNLLQSHVLSPTARIKNSHFTLQLKCHSQLFSPTAYRVIEFLSTTQMNMLNNNISRIKKLYCKVL